MTIFQTNIEIIQGWIFLIPMNLFARQDILLVSIAVVIILAAIAITSIDQGSNSTFSQVIIVGPIWDETTWVCQSDKDFVVHGAIRGLGNGVLAIRISGLGTQGLYSFESGQMESFSVGAKGGQSISFVREGTVSGWLTLQTMSDANASCNNA